MRVPNPLPDTLPIGTIAHTTFGQEYKSVSELKLRKDDNCYIGNLLFPDGQERGGGLMPHQIDWSTTSKAKEP